MPFELDKWPLFLQIPAALGILVATLLVYMRGSKTKPELDESPIMEELRRIRSDAMIAIEALKVSMREELAGWDQWREKIEDRVRDVETRVAVLDDRQQRTQRR